MTIADNPSPVTAIVPTLDEESLLEGCLESLSWADQVIVIDSGSRDRTQRIARDLGAEVIERPFDGYGAQRNAAVAAARNDWVLCVDADERVTPELRDELRRLLATTPPAAGYRIRRRTRVMGRWIRYCGWQRDRVLRLYDRRRGSWDDRRVHERVILDGPLGDLDHELDHLSFRDVPQFAAKTARYADLGALAMYDRGRRATAAHLFVAPLARFLRMYVLQRGFLDGVPGIIICSLAAWGVLLKYARLWELGRRS